MTTVAEAFEDLTPEQRAKVEARIAEIQAKLEDAQKQFDALTDQQKEVIRAKLQVFRDEVRLAIDKFRAEYVSLSPEDRAKVDAEIDKRVEDAQADLVARLKAL